ncbi:hypothetical protein ACFX2C_039724 [Malus domestica]
MECSRTKRNALPIGAIHLSTFQLRFPENIEDSISSQPSASSTDLLYSTASAFVSLSLLRAPLEDYNFSFLSYKHEGRVEAGQKRFLSASGYVAVSPRQRPVRHSVVCEVATKKPDSAVKRDWHAEKRRIYNKSQKSEIKTRMKKVLLFSASSFDFS